MRREYFLSICTFLRIKDMLVSNLYLVHFELWWRPGDEYFRKQTHHSHCLDVQIIWTFPKYLPFN